MTWSAKGRFPWPLGATSYVIPGDITANVRFLASRVDDIQLLFFEASGEAALPNPLDVAELASIAHGEGLTYTVHLPGALRLGAAEEKIRYQAVAEILAITELTAPLAPRCYDLHLSAEPRLSHDQWLGHLHDSLSRLSRYLDKGDNGCLAIENTDYPFAWILPLVRECGLPLCFDWGHALQHQDPVRWRERDFLATVTHIHLHGIADGRDHLALHGGMAGALRELGLTLVATGWDRGIVTIEVYSEAALAASLAQLESLWDTLKAGGGNVTTA